MQDALDHPIRFALITVIYVLRDGNERELFCAFSREAAEDAELQAMTDARFGIAGRDVAYSILIED